MDDAVGFEAVKPLREASPLVRFAALALNLDACVLATTQGKRSLSREANSLS
jgi:hypothetical protein